MVQHPSYPLAGVPSELQTGGGELGVFDTPDALAINTARMRHLDSLGLPLAGKSVLDVGSGVGHLARVLLEWKCRVVCTDGRPENVDEIKRRLTGVPAYVMRADSDPLLRLGRFDVVFCYGLLYHLENPISCIRNLASVCDDLLLLETVVSDHELPLVRLLDEPPSTANQALDGLGCRPTPSFVAMALTRAGFDFVYAPITQPRHPDFEFQWQNNLDCARNNHLLRTIFVAARRELANPQLRLLLRAPAGHRKPAYFTPVANSRTEKIWLDVGAHLGERTFASAEQNPDLRVYAFEPNLHIANQRMGQLPNFVVLPIAIAEHNGSASFYINIQDAASSLLEFVPEGLDKWIGKEELRVERTCTVPTMRLDTFLDACGIQRVDFLKVDAQGADLDVVKSCGERLRDIERIEIEVQVTPAPLYKGAPTRDDVIRYLESAGFELESSETQSHGQEENLSFVYFGNPDPTGLIAEAGSLSSLRPLRAYPGWRFGIDWDNSDPHFRRRRRIWSHCNRLNLDLPLPFNWYNDLQLILYLGNDTSRALFIGGSIDPNEFAFLNLFLQPGMCVVDAGANEGLYTLFSASRVGEKGRVLSFEPSPREITRLGANIEHNGLTNVSVYPIALGDREGTGLLRVASQAHSGQNTLGEFFNSDVLLGSEETIRIRPLDSVLSEIGISQIDVIKIDVEGAESHLIRGAADSIRKYRPVLLFEVSNEALAKQSSSSEDLLHLIRSFEYVLYVFDSATGLPRLAQPGETTNNMIATPKERPLPESSCAGVAASREMRLQDLTPLSGKSALVEIKEWRVFNDSSVSGSGPVLVSTRAEQWYYAVGFPINEKARNSLRSGATIRIGMQIEVEHGEIGIGIVGSDNSTYLLPEQRYAAPCKAECALTLAYIPPESLIIVRNTAAGGVISRAVIHNLRSYLLLR